MAGPETILDRFAWDEGLPTMEARAAAASLAEALGERARAVPVARGFVGHHAVVAAIVDREIVFAQRRLMGTVVSRVPLDDPTRVTRTDEQHRIVLEVESRSGLLALRLVAEPACEEFARALASDAPGPRITFENYLGRRRPKGNL